VKDRASDRPSGPDALGALRALAAKYHELASLRRARERGEPPPPKEVFRRLAAAHPGALYELDTLDLDAIEARAEALERALAGRGAIEPWMRWMARYHQLVHEELGARRRARTGGGGPRARATAVAIERIAGEEGVAAHAVAAALFARPRRGVPRRD
jgi:hypothetical protein